MPTEDRRKGKLLPNPVDPENTVCYTIQIPNAVPYRAAFLGQLDVLGRALTWDHPTDGTECEDCEEAAQLWRNALYLATWSDECEVLPMSCDDVADCIEKRRGCTGGDSVSNRHISGGARGGMGRGALRPSHDRCDGGGAPHCWA